MSFNEKEYLKQYKKEHYSKLSVDLTKEKKEELIKECREHGITIKQFIIDSLETLKQQKK